MVWQDFAIATIDIFLSYALLPQIIQDFKRKKSDITLQTAIIATLGLYALAFVVCTLGLIFSTIVTLISAIFWSIIIIQVIKYNKNHRKDKK